MKTASFGYKAVLRSADLNQRFGDLFGGSILNGFRLVKGTSNYNVSIVRANTSSSVLMTTEGIRLSETDDVIDAVSVAANSGAQDRHDVLYVNYATVGSSQNATFTYELIPGVVGAQPDILKTPGTRMAIGVIRVRPNAALTDGDLTSLPLGLKSRFGDMLGGGGEVRAPEEFMINVLHPPKETGLDPYVIGGDVTTNTQNLQAILDFLVTKGYGNMYFPNLGIDEIGEGRFYLINDTLGMTFDEDWALPLTIEGEDYGSYIYMQDDTKMVFKIDGVNNIRDFRIKNLTIRGGTYGIWIKWCAYLQLEKINLRGQTVACLYFENTFGHCENIWMFHTSSRQVEQTGNGHIIWQGCTFGEDAGGYNIEDSEAEFVGCKFLALKSHDDAETDLGIAGGDDLTGARSKAIFYAFSGVSLRFTNCSFIHYDPYSYLFYFHNSKGSYRFSNCEFEISSNPYMFAFRNPSTRDFQTSLKLSLCKFDGVCTLLDHANSDPVRNFTVTNCELTEGTQITDPGNALVGYKIHNNDYLT